MESSILSYETTVVARTPIGRSVWRLSTSFVFTVWNVPGAPVAVEHPVHQFENDAVPGTLPHALTVGITKR